MRHRCGVLFVLLLALAVGPAVAQQKGLTWLAFSKVNTGMVEEAVAFTLEDREFYDGLMADGTIFGWGLGTRVSHRPDDGYNFVQWVVLADWKAVDKWVAAFGQVLRSRSAEERDALEARAEKIFAPGSHSDIVAEDLSWSDSGGARPRYVYVGEFFAHPGQEGALTDLYKSLVPPVGQKLIAEGLLAGFGLHTPSLHTGDGWTHTSYLLMTSLGAIDRYHEEITKALTPEVVEKLYAAHDVARHRDSVWMILHLGGGGGSAEGGGEGGS